MSSEVSGKGYHLPVMLEEVMENLVLQPSGAYLDATLGGGGHARALLSMLGPDSMVIGLDRDSDALAEIENSIEDGRLKTHHSPFSRLGLHVVPSSLAGAIFDLGVSSHQLERPDRGFTFEPGAELDMRMDRRQGPDAAEYLRAVDEDSLAAAFRENSDLPRARRLARAVKDRLPQEGPVSSDLLGEALDSVGYPARENRQRLLARVAQAIRMEVNRELDEVDAGLRAVTEALRPGGRLCVLSYHSVEDRRVKSVFRDLERNCTCPSGQPVCTCGGHNQKLRRVHRKPLLPTAAEIAANPRARSAKLRVMERVS